MTFGTLFDLLKKFKHSNKFKIEDIRLENLLAQSELAGKFDCGTTFDCNTHPDACVNIERT